MENKLERIKEQEEILEKNETPIYSKMAIIFVVLTMLLTACSEQKENVDIVISQNAGRVENLAAKELQSYLVKLYPDYSFDIKYQASPGNQAIMVGTVEHLDLPETLLDSVPANPEGFLITSENKHTAIITCKEEDGLMFGVYRLLEKLGCRFFLDTEYIPEHKVQPDFNKWRLTDEPLVSERYANPWEVYLEGCSSWDLDKWKEYIRNIQQMGFNSILVHAYGNNPMFTFDFNGKSKTVGFLTSSAKGRSWGQKHINDVRRLPGGKSLFSDKVFGSEIALVPDNERVKLTQEFMGEVFNYAAHRGVKVNFALDFDILSNIPQDLVMTLPESDRFPVTYQGIDWMGEQAGTYWIPRPDKPEGYRYYKTQVEQILNLYPQLSTYTLWRRAVESIYCSMDYEDLPDMWKEEYNLFIKNHPGSDTLSQSVGTFAQRKLAIAYDQIFKDLGRSDIQLAIGSWRLINIETMDRFLPENMKIIILDSEIKRDENNLKSPLWIHRLSSILKKGRFLPIIWAHHDDGEYVGSPFKEFDNFHDLISSLKADGFAVIHWINRPLDLFFINHNRQVWKNTKNETAAATCQFVAEGIWYNNPESAHKMEKYLLEFWHDFPPISRANSPSIFDRALNKYGSPDSMLLKIGQRRAYLNTFNTDQFSLEQKRFFNFFDNYELFLKMLIENQLMYEQVENLIKQEKFDEAKNITNKYYPEKTMEQLGKAVDESFVTNGDMGILFSMGVRWLPHFIAHKQCLGLEPTRINFATTLHEPLAQYAGKETYFIDSDKAYWEVLGEKETGLRVVGNNHNPNQYEELFEKGVLLNSEMSVKLNPIRGKKAKTKVKYTLELLLASTDEPGSIEVQVGGLVYKLNINEAAIETIDIELDGKLNPEIKFMPQKGNPLVCGMILKIRD